MIKKLIKAGILVIAAAVSFSSCKKTEYSFGDLKVPADLAVTAVIEGKDATNPNGNGTGKVLITITSSNALNYKIDFGDGTTQMVPSGVITYKYASPGTNDFVITINAIGTGGATSTISTPVKVFVNFVIPAAILQSLTDGSSKIWVTDNDAVGHFGVGPNTEFSPIWYAATPNSREACAYDDEITFSKDIIDRVSVNVNNSGMSFSIGAATGFYGVAGGDGCYNINTGGTKMLAFSNATSGSTAAVSTQIEFVVPGNGIINFGTGGTRYEILAITATQMKLRNIGADGNSWYQILKKKP
jgi:hypothetical protein